MFFLSVRLPPRLTRTAPLYPTLRSPDLIRAESGRAASCRHPSVPLGGDRHPVELAIGIARQRLAPFDRLRLHEVRQSPAQVIRQPIGVLRSALAAPDQYDSRKIGSASGRERVCPYV